MIIFIFVENGFYLQIVFLCLSKIIPFNGRPHCKKIMVE